MNDIKKEQKIPLDVAQEHAREILRYLLVCTRCPGNTFPMVHSIDGFWHTFLLYTKLYADFCYKLAGHFIRHNPFFNEKPSPAEVVQSLKKYKAIYYEIFGEYPPRHI